MAVLVTGGLGFIGSHVTREFLEAGEQVVASGLPVDRVAPFLAPWLDRGLAVETIDLCSPHGVIELCRGHAIDSIVHMAGPLIGVMAPAEEYRQVTTSLMNLLEAARIVGARRFSFASSIACYFGVEGPFVREDAFVRVEADHPVEAAKKAEELFALQYGTATGLGIVSLRLASIWGPLYSSRRHLPARLVHAAVEGVPGPLALPGVPDYHVDDHATDLCYVRDAARGIRLVHSSDRLRHRIYNIGGGVDVTNRRFLEAAESVFPDARFAMAPGKAAQAWPGPSMSIARAQEDAGYDPAYSIEQAMADYAAWLREGHPR